MITERLRSLVDAIAEDTRMEIVEALAEGPLSHKGILRKIERVYTVWYHLTVLRSAGIVIQTELGPRDYTYRLNPDALIEISEWLRTCVERARLIEPERETAKQQRLF